MNGEMAGNKPAIFDRSAASDLWRHTLSQIPSLFGRLAYFSSLRKPNGNYEHQGLSLIFGQVEANRALKKAHSAAFLNWLTFNLEQQKADLDLYLAGLFDKENGAPEMWVHFAPDRNLIPASVRSVERRLFLTDLNTLMELFRDVYIAEAESVRDCGFRDLGVADE